MAAAMIDVGFALQGRTLPREYGPALADALCAALPWLAEEPAAGVHRLKLVTEGGGEWLVSPRTRLVLRVPRARAPALDALAGVALRVGRHCVRAGPPRPRELLAWGTLYAPLVAAEGDDEPAFVLRLRAALAGMDVPAQPVCGRWHASEGVPAGCSVMLSGLDAAGSLRVLQQGVGPHRLLGCGLFVPHKSAAAVGAPD